MKIAVFGLGYVGLIATGCLTRQGHQVLAIDVSEKKIRALRSGQSPITEPQLDEMLEAARNSGSLQFFTSVPAEFNECEAAVVCVGTPGGADGAHNMSYIAEVTRQIGEAVDPQRAFPLTIMYRSTLRPGTIDDLVWPILRTHLGKDTRAVEIVYSPEFLRETTGVNDYFHPPKIVIGTKDAKPNNTVDEINKGIDAPVFYTNFKEAEFTKFVDNTFHALKVTFANEIGRICLLLDIDASLVHKIFISDTKLNISPAYLRPGGPFGGSCLPKDVRALQYISNDVSASTHLIDSLIRSNEAHKAFLWSRLTSDLPKGSSVLMIGLAFKMGSDDLRESPKIDLARKLLEKGYMLSIYDPWLEPEKLIGQNLGYGYGHLPKLPELLISLDTVKQTHFDLAIDTDGAANSLPLKATRIVNINKI